jgi:hypothetical protein
MKEARRNEFIRVLEIVAKSYLSRAEVLPDWEDSITRYMNYLVQARKIEGRSSRILAEVIEGLEPFLTDVVERKRLISFIKKEKNNFPRELREISNLL